MPRIELCKFFHKIRVEVIFVSFTERVFVIRGLGGQIVVK
jgi:hypothetical protein